MVKNIRRQFKSLIPATVALAAFASSAQATIIIDRFNPPPLHSVSTTAAAATFNNGTAEQDLDGDIIGNWRRLSILKTAGQAGLTRGYEAQVIEDEVYGTGVLSMSSGTNVRGKTLLQYTGDNSSSSVDSVSATGKFNKPGSYNLGNVDLTQGGTQAGITFRGTNDLAFDMHFRVYKSATEFAVGTINLPVYGGDDLVDFYIPFTAFTTTGASLQDILVAVNALQIELDNSQNSNVDANIDFVGTYSAIPEPASMALMGGGMLALGLLRRRFAK